MAASASLFSDRYRSPLWMNCCFLASRLVEHPTVTSRMTQVRQRVIDSNRMMGSFSFPRSEQSVFRPFCRLSSAGKSLFSMRLTLIFAANEKGIGQEVFRPAEYYPVREVSLQRRVRTATILLIPGGSRSATYSRS